MDKITANRAAIEAAESAGVAWRYYSGRAYMGASVVAVSGRDGEPDAWAAELPKALRKSMRKDSMGRGEVYYLAPSYATDEDELVAALGDEPA